jgi:glycosyltransferase involved in cell wall biosynthesis
MRIAHVLTYVSVDGAFGGPVAVADAQTRELARRGHQVQLLAGWDGAAVVDIPGVNVLLFPTIPIKPLGFSGLLSPQLGKYLREALPQLDVVHIHLGRHIIPVTAARLAERAGVPLVLQTHGMVMPDNRLKSRLVDRLAVRSILENASTALALTQKEAAGLENVSPDIFKVQTIRNGIASAPSWNEASDETSTPEVLFIARLHPRKRVLAFAEMAAILFRRGIRASFRVVGPDEGDLPALLRFIAETPTDLSYEGTIAPGSAGQRLRRASVYVLPSVGEVFPMTVLEALSVGTPVVMTDDCGISSELSNADAAVVTDGTALAMADAVELLLTDVQLRARIKAGMSNAISTTFGIDAVVNNLELIYSEATAQGTSASASRGKNPT